MDAPAEGADCGKVSSVSTPFDSSSSVSRTGYAPFDADVAEVSEYFDCELDPPFADEQSALYGAIVKLPYYPPGAGAREFAFLRVTARPSDAGYTAEYSLEKLAPWMETCTEEVRQSWLRDAEARSRRIYRQKARHPSLVCFIDCLYYVLEQRLHPRKDIAVRDFCYSVYDPRHWGRPLPGLLDRLALHNQVWRARAKYDFAAGAEGELSIREGELLFVLADLGNGWLSARKHPVGMDDEASGKTGLVPENYVQRV